MSPFDLKRLEAYANNTLDYHVVLDLLPAVCSLYFERRLGEDVKLSAAQSAILVALGAQRKTVEEVEKELGLPVSQALALFAKTVRKISKKLNDIQKEAVGADIPVAPATPAAGLAASRVYGKEGDATDWKPVPMSVAEELDEAGDEETRALKEKQRAMIDALDMSKYAINDAGKDWSSAEAQVGRIAKGAAGASVVSVKSAAASGGQKRKADGDGGDGGGGGEGKKGTRRGKKTKR